MAHRSGNPTWVDYPSTATLVTAARLEALEGAVDTSVVVAGDLGGTAAAPVVAKVNGVAVTGTPTAGQVPTATSGTAATWQTPAGGAPPFVWLYRSSDMTYPVSTLTTITWNAEAEDASGFHDLVTNTDRLTVPAGQGGLYQVSFSFKLSGSGIGASAISVQKNGGTILPDITSPITGATAFGGVALLRLAAADYLSVQIFTNAGTTLALTGGATQSTGSASFMQMVRVGS